MAEKDKARYEKVGAFVFFLLKTNIVLDVDVFVL